jgi:hypothetical protein
MAETITIEGRLYGEQRPDRLVVPSLVRRLELAEHVDVAVDVGHLDPLSGCLAGT